MTDSPSDVLAYYARPGPMTDPGQYAPLFAELPDDVPSLCRIVQGCMLHIFWAERYSVTLPEERQHEVQIRPVERKLQRLLDLDNRPLTATRPPEAKLVGNCRDFSLMLTAMLRHKGIPARARCGFGMYFAADRGEDHWVCEYWHADEQRWGMVDPQLDDIQKSALHIAFDPLDMPPGHFLTGGQVWLLARTGQADPDRFGIFDMHGLWFIRGNVIRDLLALNKVEILPWDHWAIMSKEDKDLTDDDWQFLDRVAGLCQEGNKAFAAIRASFEDRRVQPPAGWQL